MKTILIFILVFGSIAYSDELYLKTGYIMMNVQVIDTTASGFLRVQTKERIRRIPIKNIMGIRISQYDPNESPEFIPFNGHLPDSLAMIPFPFLSKAPTDSVESTNIGNELQNSNSVNPSVSRDYPNMKFLPISILSFGLAWDYFAQTSDLGNAIDQAKKLNPNTDTSNLESQQPRKTILGVTFIAVGVINAIISFEVVEVKASPNSLS